MKILLENCNLSDVYLRYRDLLEKSKKYDIIVSVNKLSSEILNTYKKILLVERMDSSGIGIKTRRVLDHPHIKTCLKMYYMESLEDHNKPALINRLFLNSSFPCSETVPYDIPVTKTGFAKIKAGFNFFHYGKFNQLYKILETQNVKSISERSIDLFYSGTTVYKSPEGIEKHISSHRAKAVQNIKAIGANSSLKVEAHENGVFSYTDYIEKMLDTCVILSPFGWGEYCHRDYEALLCGCIVIKPKFPKVTQTPDIDNMLVQLDDFNNFDDSDYYHAIDEHGQDHRQAAFRGILYQSKKDERKIIEDILA